MTVHRVRVVLFPSSRLLVVSTATGAPDSHAGDNSIARCFRSGDAETGGTPIQGCLGVANGVIDLRIGSLRPGEPSDRITLDSDVSFEPEAACPAGDVPR
jgi:hypothetical protein